MEHLELPEEAGLVVTRRHGREKHHFVSRAPIRLLHDRWMSKFTEPRATGLCGLKLESERTMEKVYELYIRTTPERLWGAIVDPAIRAGYNFGSGVHSEWAPGWPIEQTAPGRICSPTERFLRSLRRDAWSTHTGPGGATRSPTRGSPV